jgi:hypothetical protein
MGYNVFDVLNKVVVYNTLNWNFKMNNFFVWFEIIINFQDET